MSARVSGQPDIFDVRVAVRLATQRNHRLGDGVACAKVPRLCFIVAGRANIEPITDVRDHPADNPISTMIFHLVSSRPLWTLSIIQVKVDHEHPKFRDEGAPIRNHECYMQT